MAVRLSSETGPGCPRGPGVGGLSDPVSTADRALTQQVPKLHFHPAPAWLQLGSIMIPLKNP